MANILVADEDAIITNIIADTLEKAGHRVIKATSGNNAIELLKKGIYDVVVVELSISPLDGISVLRAAKNAIPDVEVILMTGYSSTQRAVEAMKLGAWDYIVKPISLQRLALVVDRALEVRRLSASVKHLRAQFIEKYRLRNIMAGSENMLHALEQARKASTTDTPVLVTGERGTGKQLISRTIHTTSARRLEPFISVDLSAVDQGIIEATLFGSASGADLGWAPAYAGGARKSDNRYGRPGELPLQRSMRGAIERADRGTIFLNEITLAPPRIQEKLLEFLEYNMVSRAGSEEMIYVNARLIAASSVDIREFVSRGEFRGDLFAKLSEVSINLKPLRDRRDDIPLLVNYFVGEYSKRFGKEIQGVSPESLSLFMSYNWPGNVRELENAIRRAVILANDSVIPQSSLPHPVRASKP